MTIELYNTRTKTKAPFVPLDPQNVRMYVCGPTVYDRAHLGNARPAIVFDVLYRLLRHEYGADHVTYVRNFTDVDDKINARAAETGREISDITAETTQWYLDDMAEIGVLEPTRMPRATAYIAQMVAMIKTLLRKGYAYSRPISYGHNSQAIYFDSQKVPEHAFFEVGEFDKYGELSGRTLNEMISGARSEIGEGKKSPMDFVLWKPSTIEEPGWDSPWGVGRPGWHIECSAMAKALLGEVFDIHGGGNDLMFPHHENEIAQSCCANGTEEMARVWMHNEMLQVEGKKMSKSLGNFFTVRDLLDEGVPGEVIRFVMLSTHYRKPMDWTQKKREEAEDELHQWRLLADFSEPSRPTKKLLAALHDDVNTAGAIDELRAIARRKDASSLKASANLLGLLLPENGEWSWERRPINDFKNVPETHPANKWISTRLETVVHSISRSLGPSVKQTNKIGATMRNAVGHMNKAALSIGDTFQKMSTYHEALRTEFPVEMERVSGDLPLSQLDAENLRAVARLDVVRKIEEREEAKRDRQFARADQIRDEVEQWGIVLVDTKSGTRWLLKRDFDPAKLEGLK